MKQKTFIAVNIDPMNMKKIEVKCGHIYNIHEYKGTKVIGKIGIHKSIDGNGYTASELVTGNSITGATTQKELRIKIAHLLELYNTTGKPDFLANINRVLVLQSKMTHMTVPKDYLPIIIY